MANEKFPKVTLTNLVCITYQSNNFLMPHHFIGHSQEEAQAKLDKWLAVPTKSIAQIEQEAEDIEEIEAKEVEKIGKPSPLEESRRNFEHPLPHPPEKKSGGRGAHFAGKIWMAHFGKKEKVRIDPAQKAEYEAQGYVSAGPRTQF